MYHITNLNGFNPVTSTYEFHEITIDPTLCIINFDKVKELEEKSKYTKELIKQFLNIWFEYMKTNIAPMEFPMVYMTLKEHGVIVRENSIKRRNAALFANEIVEKKEEIKDSDKIKKD